MQRITLIVLFTALWVGSAAASTDPFLGKWTLDVKKSKYPAGTCPKSMLIEMDAAGDGIRYRSDATFSNGRTTHAQYTADYRGTPATVMGLRSLMLPVSLKRVDRRTVIATYLKGFEAVATSKRVVSTDGKHMTITTMSRDQSGKKATTIGFYTKK
jgi:hypothetical protein